MGLMYTTASLKIGHLLFLIGETIHRGILSSPRHAIRWAQRSRIQKWGTWEWWPWLNSDRAASLLGETSDFQKSLRRVSEFGRRCVRVGTGMWVPMGSWDCRVPRWLKSHTATTEGSSIVPHCQHHHRYLQELGIIEKWNLHVSWQPKF